MENCGVALPGEKDFRTASKTEVHMIEDVEKRTGKRLMMITAGFQAFQLLYAVFIEKTLPGSQLSKLPQLLISGSENVVPVFLYVFLIAWPLAISAGYLAYRERRSEFKFIEIPWAVAIPFVFHMFFVDKTFFDMRGTPPEVVFHILAFYFIHFKPVIFVASILYGWAAGSYLAERSLVKIDVKTPPQ